MQDEHWVFAYGSLMWDPQMPVAEAAVARLAGYERRFCMRSVQYRGTVDAPGLVLALDPCADGACTGVALRIDGADWPEALARLRERELVTAAYREAEVDLSLDDGRQVRALTYVMRHDHDQYAGALAAGEQARIISAARGARGPNADYLFNTVAHLDELGLPDPALASLAAEVRAILDAATGSTTGATTGGGQAARAGSSRE